MKDQFEDLRSLLQTYQFCKYAVDGIPALMPKPVQLPQRIDKTREGMLLFVADVERYVFFYYENHEKRRIVPVPPNCLLDVFNSNVAEI